MPRKILMLLLLLVLMKLYACFNIDIEKTVTFDVREDTDPSPEAVENMVFFTINMDMDGPRSIDSVCPYQCKTKIVGKEWNAEMKQLLVSISIHTSSTGELWVYGHLNLCWGDKNNIFRQFPTTLNDMSKWNCQEIILNDGLLQPIESAMEPLSLSIYTWFMGLENYNQLMLNDSTELLVPLLPDETYNLPVFLMIFHESQRDEVQCMLQRPYTMTPTQLQLKLADKNVRHYTKHLTKIQFVVEAEPEKSGIYTVSCTGKYYYEPDDKWYAIDVKKIFTLRFEEVPKIELVGHKGNIVYFPYSYERGVFYVNIYSTSDIVTVHITRSDGIHRNHDTQILTEFMSHKYYELLARYKVIIPWLEQGVTGSYTITMTNEQGQTSSLKIQLHKVEELVILVRPTRLEAEEGSSVTLQCLVLTDMPSNTTVTWEHKSNFEKEAIQSRALNASGNRKAVELTLLSTNLSHSGLYQCVADNSFQKLKGSISLTIYPAGAPRYKPLEKATWVQRMDCDKVIDTTTVENMKKAGKILTILVLVMVVATIGALLGRKIYQRMKQRKQTMSESSEEQETEKIKEDEDGEETFEVINSEAEERQPLLKSSKKERKDQKRATKEDDLDKLLETHEKTSETETKKETTPLKKEDKNKTSEETGKEELHKKSPKEGKSKPERNTNNVKPSGKIKKRSEATPVDKDTKPIKRDDGDTKRAARTKEDHHKSSSAAKTDSINEHKSKKPSNKPTATEKSSTRKDEPQKQKDVKKTTRK